jgi:hypothetical protein
MHPDLRITLSSPYAAPRDAIKYPYMADAGRVHVHACVATGTRDRARASTCISAGPKSMPLLLFLLLLVLHLPAGLSSQRGAEPAEEYDEECAEIVREVVRDAANAAAVEIAAEKEVDGAILHSEGLRRQRTTHRPLSSQRESLAPVHVDVQIAQATRVAVSSKMFSVDDIELALKISRQVQASTADPNHGNAQNAKHALARKHCTFLNKRPATANRTTQPELPADPFRTEAPHLLRKILQFADQSWRLSDWSASGNALEGIAGPGSLHAHDPLRRRDGVAGLQIRIVEHWKYLVGGHLHDDFHYDGGSVITIVTALNDGCECITCATSVPRTLASIACL